MAGLNTVTVDVDVEYGPRFKELLAFMKGAAAMREPYWVVAVKEPTKNEAEDGGESEIVELNGNRFNVVMAASKEEAVLSAAAGVKIEKGVKVTAGPFRS